MASIAGVVRSKEVKSVWRLLENALARDQQIRTTGRAVGKSTVRSMALLLQDSLDRSMLRATSIAKEENRQR
jgi:hypothetical protein